MNRRYLIGLIFLGTCSFAFRLSADILAKPGEIGHFLLSAPSEVRAGESFELKIEARDIYNNLVPDYGIGAEREIEINVLGTGEFKPYLIKSTDFKEGRAIVECSYTRAEPIKIILKERNSSAFGSVSLSVIPGETNHFDVLLPSEVIIVNEPFPVKLIVKDTNGNCITSFGQEGELIKIQSDQEIRFDSDYLNKTIFFKNGVALITLKSFSAGKFKLLFIDEESKTEGKIELEVKPGEFHHFEVIPPPTVVTGKPFETVIQAKDIYDNLVTDYEREGQGAMISTTGTGLVKPEFIPASSFNKGVARVNFIYTKAEPFTIIAEERSEKGKGRKVSTATEKVKGFVESELKKPEKSEVVLLDQSKNGTSSVALQESQSLRESHPSKISGLSIFKPYSSSEIEKLSRPMEEGYLLGPGDVIKIGVWNEPELSGEFTIDERGKISYPLLEEIKVSGLTCGQLNKILAENLKKYLKSPQITVTTKEFSSQKIMVLGEIKGKGIYPLKGATKIFEFLTSIGETSEEADISNIILMRKNGIIQVVNLNKILFEGNETENLYLQGGDRIYIPALKTSARNVLVFGEAKVGTYPLEDETRILDILASIGGTTKDADISQVKVTRKDGTIQMVNLSRILFENKNAENIFLNPGDRIYIPSLEKTGKKILVFGEVRKPGVYLVRENLTLSEAIVQAGSFTPEAIFSDIKVIRGNLEKPVILSLNLSKLFKKGDRTDDILLEPNDIIYVPKTLMGNINRYIGQILPTIQLIGWGHAISGW